MLLLSKHLFSTLLQLFIWQRVILSPSAGMYFLASSATASLFSGVDSCIRDVALCFDCSSVLLYTMCRCCMITTCVTALNATWYDILRSVYKILLVYTLHDFSSITLNLCNAQLHWPNLSFSKPFFFCLSAIKKQFVLFSSFCNAFEFGVSIIK